MAYGDDQPSAGGLFFSDISVNSTPPSNCGGCDHLPGSKKQTVGDQGQGDPLLAIKILSGVARLKGRFGQGMAVKMLTGSKEKAIERFGLDRLSTYGLLSEFNQEQMEKWIQELMGRGFLRQESATLGEKRYRVLFLTPSGMGGDEKKGEDFSFLRSFDKEGSKRGQVPERITKGALR